MVNLSKIDTQLESAARRFDAKLLGPNEHAAEGTVVGVFTIPLERHRFGGSKLDGEQRKVVYQFSAEGELQQFRLTLTVGSGCSVSSEQISAAAYNASLLAN